LYDVWWFGLSTGSTLLKQLSRFQRSRNLVWVSPGFVQWFDFDWAAEKVICLQVDPLKVQRRMIV
jgi:hypothetical protein